MSGVRLIEVAPAEGDQRLDRWFKHRFPGLAHGPLEKLLRTGQIRVDGGRAKAATRLAAGMVVRVPPLDERAFRPPGDDLKPAPRAPSPQQAAELRQRILHMDEDVIAIDKPAGLAVQGGTGTATHLDGMLEALRFDSPERPRLVHRLDKDTSGVLLLARSAASARWLAAAFRDKEAQKIYWAAVQGLPRPQRGRIDLAVGKQPGEDGGPAPETRDAVTYYTVLDQAGQKAAWLALLPVTGRTHQLRIHCAALGTPILGDRKYGDRETAGRSGVAQAKGLHLHARRLRLRRPDGKALDVTAPLPTAMAATWDFLGWSEAAAEADPFAELGRAL